MVIYAADTPAKYLAALEDDWRKDKLLAIRDVIFQTAPDWTEGMKYKMLGYFDGLGSGDDDAALVMNAQKGYVALYAGNLAELDPEGDLLAGLDCGKSCIRLKKRFDPTDGRLSQILDAVKKRRATGGSAH